MYSKPKKTRRRQLLQLDYDDTSSRSTPSPSTFIGERNESPQPPPKTDLMDDEFSNFMAEIDAIDNDNAKEKEQDADTCTENVVESKEQPVVEATCDWQQCLDTKTNCYYYWHKNTNEVRWDVPAEFTDYLRVKYQQYEATSGNVEEKDANTNVSQIYNLQTPAPPPPESSPPPPPPPEDEEEDTSEQEPVVSTEQGRNFLWFMRDHEREEKARQEEKRRAYAQKFVKGKTLDEEKQEIIPEYTSREEDRMESLKRLSGHSIALLQGKKKSSVFSKFVVAEKENGAHQLSPSEPKANDDDADQDDDDDEEDEIALLLELQQKQEELMALEMETRSPSEPPNTDSPIPPLPELPSSPPPPPEPEPAKSSRKKMKMDHDSKFSKASGEKRKHSGDEFVPKEGSLAVTKDQAVIEDLSSDITGKLESLQITRDSLSKMQILLVEVQTRIVDWVAGALTTSYLINKLRDADKEINDFVSVSTPSGWNTDYDRESKQYYYTNLETGQAQWEYPVTKADLPLEFSKNGEEVEPPPRPPTPSPPPPPDIVPPPPPPGLESQSRPLPPPPPPPGLEPSSPEHVDMDIDEEAEVTVPELLPPPVPAALRPPPVTQPYYPMGGYYPRPRPPLPPPPPMAPYNYPVDNSYYPPAPPAAPPEPAPRPAHVSAAPVLFTNKAKTTKPEHLPPEPAPPMDTVVAPPVVAPPEPAPPPSGATAPPPPPPSSAVDPGSHKKKKKKDKLKVNDSLSLRKKNVTGLVMKWHQAQQQVTDEVSRRIVDEET